VGDNQPSGHEIRRSDDEGGEQTGDAHGGNDAQPRTTANLTPWHLAGLGLLILGIVVVLLIVMPRFDAERDTATGVLGVVIPAFATIGAALFGVSVGYNAGQASGTETGKAAGAAGKQQAVAKAQAHGRKEIAEQLVGPLKRAHKSVDNIVGSLVTALPNPPEGSDFLLNKDQPAPASLRLSIDDVAAAPEGVNAAQAICSRFL